MATKILTDATQIGGHMCPVLKCMCFQKGDQIAIILVNNVRKNKIYLFIYSISSHFKIYLCAKTKPLFF